MRQLISNHKNMYRKAIFIAIVIIIFPVRGLALGLRYESNNTVLDDLEKYSIASTKTISQDVKNKINFIGSYPPPTQEFNISEYNVVDIYSNNEKFKESEKYSYNTVAGSVLPEDDYVGVNQYQLSDDFVFTIESNGSDYFTVVTNQPPETILYHIDCWNDGVWDGMNVTSNSRCVYDEPGIYQIRIREAVGDGSGFSHFYNADNPDRNKLLYIDQWGSIKWTSFEDSFLCATNLSGIRANDTPDLSLVKSLQGTFAFTNLGSEDFNDWDTSTVQNFRGTFASAWHFNGDVSSWDLSSATNTSSMFENNVELNKDISAWNTSNVTDMKYMFFNAQNFNQDITNWDTSKVILIEDMFHFALSFNQNISKWNISLVKNLDDLFHGAAVFDQDISNWDVSGVLSADDIFTDSGLSAENYDQILFGWALQEVQSGVLLGASNIFYCSGYNSRGILIASGWIISGDKYFCDVPENDFVFSRNSYFSGIEYIASLGKGIYGSEYLYHIDCDNDGHFEYFERTGYVDCRYKEGGVKTIRIRSGVPNGAGFTHFQTGPNPITIVNWGNAKWTSFYSAFENSPNVTISATDQPDLSLGPSLSGAFRFAKVNADLNNWDVSIVKDFSFAFEGTLGFNKARYVSGFTGWDMSSAENLTGIFKNNFDINYEGISNWNTSSVKYMGSLFSGNYRFNQDISSWDTSNVVDMSEMFSGATVFNQNLTSWNTSNVINMSGMFRYAKAFDQDISSWDTSQVEDMSYLFSGTDYNNNLSMLDTSKVRTMNHMFFDNTKFDQDLSNWDTSNVIDMNGMFINAFAFNQDISSWDTSNVVDMGEMFRSAKIFNQNISGWNTMNVKHMNNMFTYASAFNQDLSTWNTSNVVDMSFMFQFAPSFNQDLSDWDTSNVVNMSAMFQHATAFNQDLSSWNISSLENAISMLSYSGTTDHYFNLLLLNWAAQNINRSILLGSEHNYVNCDGIDGYDKLVLLGWEITSAGNICNDPLTDFVFTINTGESTNFTFNIGLGELYVVCDDNNITNSKKVLYPSTICIYAHPGQYTLRIKELKEVGLNPRMFWVVSDEKDKLLSIDQWGAIKWGAMDYSDSVNLRIFATDLPNTSAITSFYRSFSNTGLVVENFMDWDISNVKQFDQMFSNSKQFNGDISGWNISNAESMRLMFQGAENFNQNLSSWDTSKVTDMDFMFNGAKKFNQDISRWDVGSLMTASGMLNNTNFSHINYDNLLDNWGDQVVLRDVYFSTSATYCSGASGREVLVNDYGWKINDRGKACGPKILNPGNNIPQNGEIISTDITWLRVEFDQIPMLGNQVGSAENTDNYLLIAGGLDKVVNTVGCKNGLEGDDINVSIDTINVNMLSFYFAILNINSGIPLSNGDYALFVCGTGDHVIMNERQQPLNDGKIDHLINFTVQKLTPISPSGTTLDTNPTYTFEEVPGAESYKYEVYQGNTLKFYVKPSPTACVDGICTDNGGSNLTPGDYRWRLTAKVNGVWMIYSDYMDFTVAALTQIAPKGTITDDTPTFTWSTVPGATNYELVVSGLSPVEVPSTDCSTNCTYTFADPFDGGSYTWKVSMYLDGTWTAYTGEQGFGILKFTLLSPSGTTLDTSPTYTWKEIPGAQYYYYEVYKGATKLFYQKVTPSVCSVGTCGHNPGKTLTAADHSWRLRAKVGGVWTIYSENQPFTVAALTLIGPKGSISTDTPTFSWSIVPGATKYELVVDALDPVELAANTCSGTCTYTFADPFDGGSHTWKVRMYLDGAWTAYTSNQAFNLMKLSTISPSGTTLDSNPPYVFTAVAGATRYKYEVYQGNTLKFYVKPYPTICSGNTCTDTAGSALAAGDYRWRYQAKVGGVWTVFSDFEDFTVAALTPIAPKGTITDDNPTFSWTTVSGATNYELVVSGLDPVEIPSGDCSTNCAYTFADPFNGGSYTWKVRMYLDGAWTAYTSNQAFSLMKLSTISPSGTTLDSNPPYVFTAVAGATRYKYEVYQGNTLKFYVKPYPTVCSGNTCTDTAGSNLAAGDYRWRYQAKVGGVWTVFSDFEDFTVAALTQIAVNGTVTTDTPTFIWSAVPGATNYELVVSGLDPGEIPATDCAANCEYTFADPLANGSYTWKVRMYLDGVWSDYTGLEAFKVQALTLLTPEGTITTKRPVYSWHSIPGAYKYKYEVYRGNSLLFYKKVVPADFCSGNTCAHDSGVNLANGDHSWRLQVKIDGVWSVFSESKNFTVNALVNSLDTRSWRAYTDILKNKVN